MAKENEFLNGVRIDQFIKGNNDQIKDNIAGIGTMLNTSLNAVLLNTKQQLSTMKSVDKSTRSIDKHVTALVKIQENMLKVLAKQSGRRGDKYIDDILKSKKWTSAKHEPPQRIDKPKQYSSRTSKKDQEREKKEYTKYLSKKTGLDSGSVKDAVKQSSFKKNDTGQETVLQLSLISTQLSAMVDEQKKQGDKAKSVFKFLKTAFFVIKALDLGKSIVDFLRGHFPIIDNGFNKVGEWVKNIPNKIGAFFSDLSGSIASLGDKIVNLGKVIGDKFSRMFIGFLSALNKIPLLKGKLTAQISKSENSSVLTKSQTSKFVTKFRKLTPKQQESYKKYRKKNKITANTIADEKALDSWMNASGIEADALTSSTSKPTSISSSGMPSLSDVFGVENSVGLTDDERRPAFTDSYSTYGKINLKGIRSDVWHNFMGMVQEYHTLKPNKKVQINSGFRNISYQQKLYDQYLKDKAAGKNPAPVAKPGSSMHNYGYALDINTPEANDMASLGLLSKWGFHRPVKKGTPGWETWHIEPKGLEYAKIKSGVGVTADGPQKNSGGVEADALTPVSVSSSGLSTSTNLPQGSISRPTSTNNPIPVVLSKQDIELLADAFGRQMKDNIKMPTNRPVPSNSGSPRGNL